jgi:hypothetical protein
MKTTPGRPGRRLLRLPEKPVCGPQETRDPHTSSHRTPQIAGAGRIAEEMVCAGNPMACRPPGVNRGEHFSAGFRRRPKNAARRDVNRGVYRMRTAPARGYGSLHRRHALRTVKVSPQDPPVLLDSVNGERVIDIPVDVGEVEQALAELVVEGGGNAVQRPVQRADAQPLAPAARATFAIQLRVVFADAQMMLANRIGLFALNLVHVVTPAPCAYSRQAKSPDSTSQSRPKKPATRMPAVPLASTSGPRTMQSG